MKAKLLKNLSLDKLYYEYSNWLNVDPKIEVVSTLVVQDFYGTLGLSTKGLFSMIITYTYKIT